ncbi:MAG: sigma 54-interacting transcriptional regulator [Desulfobacteraceae bacterium]|nr:sigma 54-interacting transcriptional regulator [Desulfobacteraceae bacterium]
MNTDPYKRFCSVLCDQWLEVLDELNIGAFTVNLDRKLTAINFSAQALMALREKEVVGRDCREIFTGVPCVASCVIKNGEPSTSGDQDLEVRDEADEIHLITRFATPIYDRRREVSGCLTILQDHSPITDLINRLKHEEQNLKNILDSLDSGIFTVNRGGLFTFFNTAAEKISGYDRSEVLGKSCAAVFEGEDADDVCMIKETINGVKVGNRHRGNMRDRDGVPIPIMASYQSLKNEKGNIVGGLATFQDLTLVRQLEQALRNQYTYHDMIGKSPAMQKIFDRVTVVADTDTTILIEGPTGTGKDLLAKVIHSASSRAAQPLVKINCAAIPENLLESELFGYAKGAFTGAVRDKPGRFHEADGGTIFLDEIGDMPLILQAKLLRVIEDREFYPLGSLKTRKVDVRILSATNRRLESLVADGAFREDLFYRLNVFRINLPSLAERPSDLPLLIRHTLRRLCSAGGYPMPSLSQTALKLLLNSNYPGNIRELENILEHAVIVCRGEKILPEHLPDYFRETEVEPIRHGPREPHRGESDGHDGERNRIADQLEIHQWHRGKTARALGIDRTTLWRKMKRYHLI